MCLYAFLSTPRLAVFRLRISSRIWSQNRNGSKRSVMDLCRTGLCQPPKKSASLPCPFQGNLEMHHERKNRFTEYFRMQRFNKLIIQTMEQNSNKGKNTKLSCCRMSETKSKTKIGIASVRYTHATEQELFLLTYQIFWGSLLLERFFAPAVPDEEAQLTAPSHHRLDKSYEHPSCGSGSGGSVIKWHSGSGSLLFYQRHEKISERQTSFFFEI